jgi:hypothetical protein
VTQTPCPVSAAIGEVFVVVISAAVSRSTIARVLGPGIGVTSRTPRLDGSRRSTGAGGAEAGRAESVSFTEKRVRSSLGARKSFSKRATTTPMQRRTFTPSRVLGSFAPMTAPSDVPSGLEVGPDASGDPPAFRRALADLAREFLRAQPEDPTRAADLARRFVRASSVEGIRSRARFGRA